MVVIAIIGALAAILVPTMMSYIRKAKLKGANSNAKIVFNTVNAVTFDMQCEGNDIDVQSCTAVVDCTAEPDESKKLEKAVHDALNVNGDNAGYAFLDSRGGRQISLHSGVIQVRQGLKAL